MLRFDSVTFAYDSGNTPVLTDLSVEVRSGELVAVLGCNGSGKSTLVQLANGLLSPSAGSVTVDDIDTTDHARIRDVRERVGVVFQRPDDQIVATTVEDDAAFGPENLGLPREEIRARVDEAIAAVGLGGLERREPHLLSGGQKQRLAIAGALAMRPRYLVLDEPTSMLDPEGRAEVARVIGSLRSAGHGVLLVTHDLAEATMADRCVVLSDGRVAFDGPVTSLVSDSRLAGWGLELPPLWVLAQALRAAGRDVPEDALTAHAIAEAVCR